MKVRLLYAAIEASVYLLVAFSYVSALSSVT
jgi:hypothetical protein